MPSNAVDSMAHGGGVLIDSAGVQECQQPNPTGQMARPQTSTMLDLSVLQAISRVKVRVGRAQVAAAPLRALPPEAVVLVASGAGVLLDARPIAPQDQRDHIGTT
jgi:hypothetical protein